VKASPLNSDVPVNVSVGASAPRSSCGEGGKAKQVSDAMKKI
jgi:hypothetical protein